MGSSNREEWTEELGIQMGMKYISIQIVDQNKYFIDDCYALNIVADEEVWFYFYLDFSLARYNNGQIEYFKPDIAGSDGFIMYDDFVLFRDGYGKHDNYILYRFL